MADSGGETKVRKILDNGITFYYGNEQYKIIKNAKPKGETKTDFYLVTINCKNDKEKIFKISYKKPSYTFVENKIKSSRCKEIYGDNWIDIIKKQITERNTVEENKTYFKSEPNQSLCVSLENMPLIQFKEDRYKIMLGWRYEIECINKGCGNRKLSSMIRSDISAQVFWGEGYGDEKKNAHIDNIPVSNSGMPDYILVIEPSDIITAQNVFDNLQDIRTYAKVHSNFRGSFLSQYYKLEHGKWVTEGHSRSFVVWVKWEVIDKKLKGSIIFDKPLCKTANEVIVELKKCLKELDVDISSGLESLLHKTVCTRTAVY